MSCREIRGIPAPCGRTGGITSDQWCDKPVTTWICDIPVADLVDDMRGWINLHLNGTEFDETLEMRWRKIRSKEYQ
ncbi:MAG: hypothetical protein CMJ81_18035 [Planctomycetaceae bacterium]|nr:hypothetical protein [Planctomycetaceae bacterium]MBP60034.1 hypothetical protein [Planctomycetaceae bacterium]